MVTKAITVRLDEADHAALARQANQLRVSPGTLARMLVHAGLSEDAPGAGRPGGHSPTGSSLSAAAASRRGHAGQRRTSRSRPAQVSVVVDASLIIALVVADERQAAVHAHLEGWVESGQALHAPGVLPYEVANVDPAR